MSRENVEVVRRNLEAWSRGELELVVEDWDVEGPPPR
jgi:hypothetical protein